MLSTEIYLTSNILQDIKFPIAIFPAPPSSISSFSSFSSLLKIFEMTFCLFIRWKKIKNYDDDSFSLFCGVLMFEETYRLQYQLALFNENFSLFEFIAMENVPFFSPLNNSTITSVNYDPAYLLPFKYFWQITRL